MYAKTFSEANALFNKNVESHDYMAIPDAMAMWSACDFTCAPYGAENHLDDYIRARLRQAYNAGDRTAGIELNKPDIIVTHRSLPVPIHYVEVKHRVIPYNKRPEDKRDFFVNFNSYATLRMRWERGEKSIVLQCLRYHDINNVWKTTKHYDDVPLHAAYAGYLSGLTNAMRICYVRDENRALLDSVWGDAIHEWRLTWFKLANPTDGSDSAYIEVSPDWFYPFDQFIDYHFSLTPTINGAGPKSVPEICQKCGLYQNGHNSSHNLPLPGDGADRPDIIFIGEALGEEEQKHGKPFVGKSGQLLRTTVAGLGIENARYTNIVRCRPPNNRIPTPNEIKCCSQFLDDELHNHPAKVVVLLGNTALKSRLGYNGISSFEGQVINRDGVRYVPLYHPAFVLRAGPVTVDAWRSSFGSVIDALYSNGDDEAADAHYQYLYPMELDDLDAMCDELLSKPDDLVACDIESISLDVAYPDNKIISIALANSNKAWSFPIDHKDSWWSVAERQYIIEDILTPILTQCKIINHNMKFDCKMIRHFLGIDFVPYGDTIQLSRLTTPQALEHGLKRLAGVHLQMFDYDEELRQYVLEHEECDYDRGGNYGNVPLEVLLPYGGKDVSATVLLHNELYPKLTDKQRILYEQMIIKADYALGRIEENGFKLDYWIINRYMNVYQSIMDHVYMPRITADVDVQHYLKAKDLYDRLKSAKMLTERKEGKKQVCELVWADGTKWGFKKDDWHTHYLEHERELLSIDVPESKHKPEYNPGSSHQIWPVLFVYKGLKRANGEVKLTATGNPCTERNELKEIVYDLKKPNQFLNDYMDWKLLFSISNKTFKSMMNPEKDWWSADGRVRSVYTIGGAKTGRTSSSQPNLQNIPAIEKEPGTVLQYLPAKNCFTHTFPGGGLAMIDYSGMELRVMSSIADIGGMLEVFKRGGDVHRYVSSLIYKKPEDQITKDERYRGKWCNWSLLYMGGWWTLYRLYRINGLTEDESRRVADLYYDAFPELPTYHKHIEKFLKTNGYVESAFGRKLSLPGFTSDKEYERSDALRTAVNFPIQGLASDVLMVALGIIAQLLRGRGYKSMFVNTVHDSLVIDYHPDECDEIVKLTTGVMENIVDYSAEFMPQLDFSWLKVPLKADVDYGTHYGSYGFYQLPLCECGSQLEYAADLGDTIDYHCSSCGTNAELKFKPLMFNNMHPDKIPVSLHMERFMQTNNYTGPRKPRL